MKGALTTPEPSNAVSTFFSLELTVEPEQEVKRAARTVAVAALQAILNNGFTLEGYRLFPEVM